MGSTYEITVVENPYDHTTFVGVLRITREDGWQIERGYDADTRREARRLAREAKRQDKAEQGEPDDNDDEDDQDDD